MNRMYSTYIVDGHDAPYYPYLYFCYNQYDDIDYCYYWGNEYFGGPYEGAGRNGDEEDPIVLHCQTLMAADPGTYVDFLD
mmetsp:Transcript_14703/g.22793  ORF Transcript_14703/g.22793 Transcript_14703/m.22793 type:complete len:80 (-) Transcript_14703:2258-2497(-)